MGEYFSSVLFETFKLLEVKVFQTIDFSIQFWR